MKKNSQTSVSSRSQRVWHPGQALVQRRVVGSGNGVSAPPIGGIAAREFVALRTGSVASSSSVVRSPVVQRFKFQREVQLRGVASSSVPLRSVASVASVPFECLGRLARSVRPPGSDASKSVVASVPRLVALRRSELGQAASIVSRQSVPPSSVLRVAFQKLARAARDIKLQRMSRRFSACGAVTSDVVQAGVESSCVASGRRSRSVSYH